jgi:signal transduction histidine kinase
LESRCLALARVGWVGVTGLCLTLFLAAVPVRSAQLMTPPEQVRLVLRHLSLSVDFYATYNLVCEICFAVGFFSVAAVLFWRSRGKANQWLALFVALFLVAFGADTPTIYALAVRGGGVAVFVKGVDVLAWASLGFFLSLFPDGRFVPSFLRWFAALNVAYQVFWLFPDHSSVFPPNWPPLLLIPLQLSLLVVYLCAQIYRYFRVSGPVQRQQTKWLLLGLIVAGCTLPFLTGSISPGGTLPDVFGVLGIPALRVVWLSIPLSIGVALLRYRLWDIDLIINRTLIYGILTASVIGIYILVVGMLGTLLQAQGNIVIELVATGVVAVVFQPLRNGLQRGINRLMFGERDDPYRVVSHLGQRLEATLAPGEVFPAIVETVAHSLKLPAVAIRLKQDDTLTTVACYGRPREPLLHLPLIYQADMLGELVLAPRTAHESFMGSERHLLNELTRQAGIAVHTVLLTADLERSRQHIVAAREEARRRLGSDLHDGLGHTLAGLLRTVDTASHLLEVDPATAKLLLSEMKQHTKSAIEDVRRLAHSLHPPELELLGLCQALRERVQQYQQPNADGLHVYLESPPTLPPLPIAVEAATYYIALEALNNVERHARAQQCHLRINLIASNDDTLNLLPGVWNASVLELEICDDGRGLPEEAQEKGTGLGFASMVERATELGGTCLIEQVASGGTRVQVRLPCLQANAER